ncbi:molybdopterin molybdotransferase MoeA [Thermus thermamylovorans]|uniref:Molybdopterin molybdenumtransferase n=1 Tax=Thermus thermamylovorans TaxID=2509362 RepID=A0A4Q9B6N5_9DEIN|nr:gephyrin-like molybdotransferase Glp [Thermus thermamylovorans]TBH20170.1 molybdopterin molybdenumtransferase MoeA [Thermus thermamylovorans]
MRANLSVEEALELVLAEARGEPGVEELPLGEALGRVLAEDLASLADHPDQDDTAIDGYACREADALGASRESPARLRVIGESPAGRPFRGRVGPGEAVAVYTGAPIPEGTDAVVRVEDTRREGDEVLLFAPASPKDIRPKGDDLRRGEVYLRRGDLLTPGRLGLAAAMGHPQVRVFRPPRVGILSTGDEVVEPGEPLPYGGVYNSNAYSLLGLVREAGGEPVLLGKVEDEPQRVLARLEGAGRLDLLLTSGGVSMGEYDVVRKVLEERGEVLFWKVKQQPGGPLLLARLDGLPVLGLPGNPVSSMVTFFLYGRPFLYRLLRRTEPPYRALRAKALTPFRGAAGKKVFRRGILSFEGELVVRTTGNQSSGVLRSMALGNALVVIPPDQEVREGEAVEAIPLTFVL